MLSIAPEFCLQHTSKWIPWDSHDHTLPLAQQYQHVDMLGPAFEMTGHEYACTSYSDHQAIHQARLCNLLTISVLTYTEASLCRLKGYVVWYQELRSLLPRLRGIAQPCRYSCFLGHLWPIMPFMLSLHVFFATGSSEPNRSVICWGPCTHLLHAQPSEHELFLQAKYHQDRFRAYPHVDSPAKLIQELLKPSGAVPSLPL